MATHYQVNINIAGFGKVSPFTSLSLQQNISGHHQFELRVPVTVFHKDGNPAVVNDSNKLIGKTITIEFADDKSGDVKSQFSGLVTEITFNKYKGSTGDLLL